MSQPLLSICIPTYNRSRLLIGALRDMDAEGYLPFEFEVIVADNASPDDDYAAVRAFQPARYQLTYLRQERNIGMFPNVLGTMRRARGVYCAYMSDDDRLSPADLAAIIERMRADPDIVGCLGHPQDFDLVAGTGSTPPAMLGDTVYPPDRAADFVRLISAVVFLPEVGIYKTDVISTCLFPTSVCFWSFALIERLFRFGSIYLTNRPYYRQVTRHPGEPAPATTGGKSMSFQHWISMESGYRMLANRYLPADGEADALSTMRRAVLGQAFLSAIHNEALDQAIEIALLLPDLDGLIAPGELAGLSLVGGLQAVVNTLAMWPEVKRLRLHGFTGEYRDQIAAILARNGAPWLAIEQAAGFAAVDRDSAVLTRIAYERSVYLTTGCEPGRVFSLDLIARSFDVPKPAARST